VAPRWYAYQRPDPFFAELSDRGAWLVDQRGELPFPVALAVALDDKGALVCTGLAIGFSLDLNERAHITITARALRSVRLGALLADLEHALRRGTLPIPAPPSHPDLPPGYDPWAQFREHVTVPRVRRPRQRRPGRAGHPHEHYQRFAEQWQSTPGRHRVSVLAAKYDVSEWTIRRWKARAEELDLIPMGATPPTRTRKQKPKMRTRKNAR
jgi:hypothetical protein